MKQTNYIDSRETMTKERFLRILEYFLDEGDPYYYNERYKMSQELWDAFGDIIDKRRTKDLAIALNRLNKFIK